MLLSEKLGQIAEKQTHHQSWPIIAILFFVIPLFSDLLILNQINLSKHQSQAYLNEYKGNLFEYLVALEVAQKFHIQSQFMQSLGPNQWELLQHYEREIKKAGT